MPEPGDYADLTVAELKDLASDADLEGYSNLNKDDLCEFLAENNVLLPKDEDEDLEPVPDDEGDEEEADEEPEPEEEEATEEEDEVQRARIHAGHPATYEFLEEHLDHEVFDYKRYRVDLTQDELDTLLEDPGQPFVTPLA